MFATPCSFGIAVVKLILRNTHLAHASGGAYRCKARPCFMTKAGRQGFWAAPLCGARQLKDGRYGPRKKMEMGSWALVDFRGAGIPVPAHPLANIRPFVLPLVQFPEYETMKIKPCFVWIQTPGEYVTYRAFREWEIQMAIQEKQVRLDEFFDLDMERIFQLRLQHASYGGE